MYWNEVWLERKPAELLQAHGQMASCLARQFTATWNCMGSSCTCVCVCVCCGRQSLTTSAFACLPACLFTVCLLYIYAVAYTCLHILTICVCVCERGLVCLCALHALNMRSFCMPACLARMRNAKAYG